MFVLFAFLILASEWCLCDSSDDICLVCDCLPYSDKPLQAFCVDKEFGDKVFRPTISPVSTSLQFVYISGVQTVHFAEGSFETEQPLDLALHNCSTVVIADRSVSRVRSLVIQDVRVASVGSFGYEDLWSTVLENIDELELDNNIFEAKYLVKIGEIKSLTIAATRKETGCDNPELRFTLFNSVLNPITYGGLTICGSQIKLEAIKFKSIAEGDLQITAESSIKIVNNHFQHLSKKVFNLTSPEIYISGNNFDTFPAGALSRVSTLQDTFFTSNTIQDIDLGGVLLDMSWDISVENNTLNCDCASKRTSILNPKKGMLYLTNTSHEVLQNIFLNNYCNLNCSVTLETFSYALKQGDVCPTNDSRLEEEKLCEIIVLPGYNSENETEYSLVSAASRPQFLVPLSIIVVTILIASSVCYGFKEMKTFKFLFDPQRSSIPKLPSE